MSTPNVLHLSWHDVGRFLGCYGVPGIETPNVDRLAADGMLFSNYWAAASLCSPSRACALTGRYPQSIGVAGLCHAPENYHLASGVKHLSHIMRDAGRRTALVGWQHETTHDRVHADLGFDEIHHNDPCPECEVVSQTAATWLARAASDDRPFYLQVGFIEIHRSRGDYGQEPVPDADVYIPPWIEDSPAARAEMRLQQANIRKADRGVGVVLDALEAAGLAENTIVVFTSDHGIGVLPRAKATLYDAGLTIPLIVRWPDGGIVGGQTCDRYLGNVDFLPTLLDLLGLEKPDGLHGESFADSFDAPEVNAGRDAVFASLINQGRMIRTRTHKLIWNAAPRRTPVGPVNMEAPKFGPGWPIWELYDLRNDPLGTRNLSVCPPVDHGGAHQAEVNQLWEGVPHQPEVEADLRKRLREWMQRIGDPILDGIPPTHYDILARDMLRAD
jgi:N-sulfoglucosamine sulfohydrolase